MNTMKVALETTQLLHCNVIRFRVSSCSLTIIIHLAYKVMNLFRYNHEYVSG